MGTVKGKRPRSTLILSEETEFYSDYARLFQKFTSQLKRDWALGASDVNFDEFILDVGMLILARLQELRILGTMRSSGIAKKAHLEARYATLRKAVATAIGLLGVSEDLAGKKTASKFRQSRVCIEEVIENLRAEIILYTGLYLNNRVPPVDLVMPLLLQDKFEFFLNSIGRKCNAALTHKFIAQTRLFVEYRKVISVKELRYSYVESAKKSLAASKRRSNSASLSEAFNASHFNFPYLMAFLKPTRGLIQNKLFP